MTGHVGRALAMSIVVVGIVALVLAVATPPRSGPFCSSGCIGSPYTDVRAFVPRDYWWTYPQSLLVLLVPALLVCVQHALPAGARAVAGIGVVLASLGAGVLLVDYAIQLAALQPSLLRGETAGLSVLSQYNPHGVFIALEDLGYLLLGLALVCVGAAFTGATTLDRGVRWLLVVGGGATVLGLPVLAVAYGSRLEYRYELLAISLTWITLIGSGVLLAIWFARRPATALQVGRVLGERPPQAVEG